MKDPTVIIELHYLPSIPYMAVLTHYYPDILIETKESFIKQTYRNRCQILTANKINNLIVPVEKGNSNIPIQEIRIAYDQPWTKNHWRTLQSAYGNAPYFDYYSEGLHRIYIKNHRFLFDLNLDLLEFLINALKLDLELTFTQKYHKIYPHKFIDLRSVIHPKKKLDLLGFYSTVEYIQVFGEKFVPELSVIDLLFNEGPNAKVILNRSIENIENN
jgi:hypothetical protein